MRWFPSVLCYGPDGCVYKCVKGHWREFSPLHNIAVGICPIIVFLGATDALIPISIYPAVQESSGRN